MFDAYLQLALIALAAGGVFYWLWPKAGRDASDDEAPHQDQDKKTGAR